MHHAEQLVTRLRQLGMPQVGLIDQFKIEARGGTQFDNCRQIKREHEAVCNLTEGFCRAAHNGFDAVFRPRALLPGLQADEGDTGVLTLAAKAKAVYGKDGFHVRLFVVQIVVLNLIEDLLSTRLGCTRRELNHRHKHPLILFGQEGGRQAQEEHRHPSDDNDVHRQIAPCLTQNTAHAVAVVLHAFIKERIKPAEEAAFLLMMVAGYGLKQRCAECGRQD